MALLQVPEEEGEEVVLVCVSFLSGNCQDETVQAAFGRKVFGQ